MARDPGNTHVFDVVINFQTPFLYNPGAGNLLLDVRNNTGASAFVGTNFFDAVNTFGDSVSRVFGPEGNPGAVSGTADSLGLIVQFTTAAVPEPTSLALMGLTGLGVLGYFRFRRKSVRKI